MCSKCLSLYECEYACALHSCICCNKLAVKSTMQISILLQSPKRTEKRGGGEKQRWKETRTHSFPSCRCKQTM